MGDSKKTPKRVLLVDDEAIVRSWLKERIGENPEMVVIGEARDGDRGRELIDELAGKIDLIVLDLSMPGINGFDLLSEIKEKQPDTKVIVYTQYRDPVFIRKCKKYADGYMLKDEPVSRILPVLEIILKGRKYYSPVLAQEESNDPPDEFADEKILFQKLTDSQKAIARCVKQGMTSREIGEFLGKSPRTIEEQLRRIYRKLDLPNRAALARFAAIGEGQ